METVSFRVDRDLKITDWGKGISEFTGRNPSEVMGRKYFEVLPRLVIDDRDAVKTVFEKNRDLEMQGYVAACFKSSVRTGVVLKAVRDCDGRVCGVDVAFIPEVFCPVARQLDNSQWLIDIGKMATTLAHGVRNPLNAIKGAVTFLSERYAGEATLTDFTKIIEEEISRLDKFISTFLSTSLSDLDFIETDINTVMRKIEMYTSLQSRASHIDVSFLYGDVPRLKSSAFHLEQAVLNVINNAIEAMPEGGRLAVQTGVTKRLEGDYVLIRVSDNGPGMSVGKVETPGGNSGERGYGLFITREVLWSLGGQMEVDSRKGEGTEVVLYLPLKPGVSR